jgi:4-alpha-glucanotransferase
VTGARDTEVFGRRRAGVLLHPTSLPDAKGAGAFGDAARHFVDWLAVGGFTVWQVLPLGPVGSDGSPYYSRSNHAGNPQLVDLSQLVHAGLLPDAVAREAAAASGAAAERAHAAAIDAATRTLVASGGAAGSTAGGAMAGAPGGAMREHFEAWCIAERGWLDDFALFTAIQAREQGRPWWEWPVPLRSRDATALAAARRELADTIGRVRAEQFLFHTQWADLRRYANAKGVLLFGDIPIYVAPDSVEVWANPSLFRLQPDGRPAEVAGVPPDYFTADGQLWGNPVYCWPEHVRTDFAWWIERLRAQLGLYDLLRIDHFRGLQAYWSVPADAPTARTGRWIDAPGQALLTKARGVFGGLPVVAEDLGVITPEVEKLRDDFALPGMRILQFGFDGSLGNQHALHEWVPHSIGYTGTHDNDTTAGWYSSLTDEERRRVEAYLDAPRERVVGTIVRSVIRSVARLAIVPMQDLLALGTEARMNRPGTTEGNWSWAFDWRDVPADLGDRCRTMNALYGRS